ncbi:MAG: glycosyl transferase family 2 [Planctomycetota bacterium]|nr:MAG: glycosyl transferase family 2 [Planctomycetota bacterium]
MAYFGLIRSYPSAPDVVPEGETDVPALLPAVWSRIIGLPYRRGAESRGSHPMPRLSTHARRTKHDPGYRETDRRTVMPVCGGDSPSRDTSQLALAPESVTESYVKATIAIVLVVLGVALTREGLGPARWLRPPETHWGSLFWVLAFVYGGLMYAVLGWRLYLWRRYRPMARVSDDQLPSVTVVIPCFNEGPLVRESIRSAVECRYPRDRLEVIVVDDGSTDDSWEHILRAAAEFHGRAKILTLRHPKNLGKRHALGLGFEAGRGDVFVTLDSDSVLDPEALRNGVAPLVRDPRIGCVAGCVQVLNARQSLFTRFLKCSFSLSFKFVRAYQSEIRGVFCTPGALSIYRASFVRQVSDEWLHQHFLGLPCITGEDRAMTNLFLREGWLTAYQGNAVVHSKVPHTYAGLCRMFLRWARSNIRETVFLLGFLFTRFRNEHLQAFRLNIFLSILSLVLPPMLIANSFLLILTQDDYLVQQFSMVFTYGLTVAAIYYVNERDSDWLWLIVYEFFWVTCLWWILPYAFATLRKTGWLTRSCGPARRRTIGRPNESAVPSQALSALRPGPPDSSLVPANC